MRKIIPITFIQIMTALSAVVACTTCNAAEGKAASEATAPAKVYTANETARFKALTKETLEALASGNNAGAVAKLTDLETVWDEKEKVLKPKDEATWTSIDKTLDKAISALRSSKTNLPKGKVALESLLSKLELATKQ